MDKDSLKTTDNKLRHLAVIMDGNRRWAKRQGRRAEFGHRTGAENVHKLSRLCIQRDIAYLTLYAFSTENWKRSEREVRGLMRLLVLYFNKYADELRQEGVRLRFMGDRQGLPPLLTQTMDEAETTSADRNRLQLIIAFNYGGRREIVTATHSAIKDAVERGEPPQAIDEDRFASYLYLSDVPDPDLIIRTGGEMRLSNFLLWQAAYAELYFDDTLWPDFGEKELDSAIADFMSRKRRYGSS